MTKVERDTRIQRWQAQKDAIRDARTTAMLARMLWPYTADDELHGKVEILIMRLRNVGQIDAAQYIAAHAHNAAWRKVKHIYLDRDYGDVTQSRWWQAVEKALLTAQAVDDSTRGCLRLAQRLGPTDAMLRTLDAHYWLAHDTANNLWDMCIALPDVNNLDNIDYMDGLRTQFRSQIDSLVEAKDDLVTWAAWHGHTILRK